MKLRQLWITALAVCLGAPSAADTSMPNPFTRELTVGDEGNDVKIAQTMLNRDGSGAVLSVDGVYGEGTANATSLFQAAQDLAISGSLDAATAQALLDCCLADGYVDDGQSAESRGYLYKVVVPVYQNRSIETMATLHAGNNTALLTFRVRAHGHRDDGSETAWPDFGDGDFGLNELTSDGNTPTGLSTLDLNSPEPADYEELYGPYPINRVVTGLEGNAGLLLSDIRSGILLHTGEWPDWDSSQPMPNSDGCMHAHPEDVDSIWQALVSLGVEVRDNPGSSKNYPFEAQGLMSVYQVD